jgi:hypothetical protein
MKDIEKYFRVYAEVNLDAIIKNIEMMREKIKPETVYLWRMDSHRCQKGGYMG